MAGNSYNVTGDNLPKDSGNRYMMAWYDPVANNFALPWAYPVSGSAAGLVIGHGYNIISDTLTATGNISSGVDLGGYPTRACLLFSFGSASEVVFQASAPQGWISINTNRDAGISATAGPTFNNLIGASYLTDLAPFRYIRVSAFQGQTATRTIHWFVST